MPQQLHERPTVSTALDDSLTRRAQVRAIAAGLVDGPRMTRRFHVPAGVPLQPSPRRRAHAGRRQAAAVADVVEAPRRPLTRRLVGAGLLLVQVGVLAALLLAPPFRVHHVEVSGDRMLSRSAVLAAARVPTSSLFTVDGAAIEARLAALPWVRTAAVTTQLPSTVRIALTEWQPDLLVRHGGGSVYLAGDGATLALTRQSVSLRGQTPLLIDYRPGPRQSLVPGLSGVLADAARHWQVAFGCSLDAFVINRSDILSAWSGTGWQVVLGSIDSSDAVAAIPQQLAILAALRSRLDYSAPAFGYVDLENPAQPSVGGHPGEPASLRDDIAASLEPSPPPEEYGAPAPVVPVPTPTPSATPAPSAAPSATPAPAAPTASPSPTPLTLQVPPPSPTPPAHG